MATPVAEGAPDGGSTPTVLDPRRIEAELARIRGRESGPWSAGSKTTLFNLVIVRGGAPSADDGVDGALAYLLGKRPARILTITPGAGRAAEVYVSGRCHPDQRGRGVCFEEVAIVTGTDGPGGDPGAWTPLLVPDIPTFLLWAAPALPVPAMVREAAAQADKLIVDTTRADDPLALLAALSAVRDESRRALSVADLAWDRARPVRVQAARAFDPVESRPLLRMIAGVALRGGSRAEALSFFLWIAARLAWRVSGEVVEGLPVFTDAAGVPLEVRHAGAGPLAEGVALSFTIREGDTARRLDIECRGDGCVHLGSEHGAWRVAADGELLMLELDSLGQDELLEEALALARGPGQP